MMNEESWPGHSLAALAALAALALAPAAAAAQEGVLAVRDRASGQLRTPTAAELRELRAQEKSLRLVPPPAIAPSTKRADGTRHLHLGERGMVHSVVRLDPDGSHSYTCVHGEHAAHMALEGLGVPRAKEAGHETR